MPPAPSLCFPFFNSEHGLPGAFRRRRRSSLIEHGEAMEVMKRLKRENSDLVTVDPNSVAPWANLPGGGERRMSAAHNHHNHNPEVHKEEIKSCPVEETAKIAEHDKTIDELARECSTIVDGKQVTPSSNKDTTVEPAPKTRRKSIKELLIPSTAAVAPVNTTDDKAKPTTKKAKQSKKKNSKDRRDSATMWEGPDQTVAFFDWDDTLFPTSWIKWCSPELVWNEPCPDDPKSDAPSTVYQEYQKVRYLEPLRECDRAASQLLREAKKYANVGIVTLASAPWCTISVKNFMPELERTIEELQIPIMYAGTTIDKQLAAQLKTDGYCVNTIKKERAMDFMLSRFYGKYAKQSWKNVISIGDARYERYALQNAVRSHDNDSKKCRTKTLKMMSGPEIEQLTAQHKILTAWLPAMISKDENFDVDMDNDSGVLRSIHKYLTGEDVEGLGRPIKKPVTAEKKSETEAVEPAAVQEEEKAEAFSGNKEDKKEDVKNDNREPFLAASDDSDTHDLYGVVPNAVSR
ncbi:hypothetical protein FOL47_005341 [Perkinsus chesapeaki]|uniref:Uncharacterized protein n=1 Tax=Perkinsus chesapeaki TaxID=330153 RepID=A0A7J6LYX9_PERCH|nr:hypothetical protein FOL47_005341 [Perkinsus chesapeaki]